MKFFEVLNNVLRESNVYVAGMMVVAIAVGIFLFARSLDTKSVLASDDSKLPPKIYPGYPSALLCWLTWWLILLVVHTLIPNPTTYYWIILLLDGFGNIALLGVAACLLPQDKALPTLKFIGYLLSASLVLLVWNLLLGAPYHSASVVWKITVSSLGIFLAMGAFILLAYTAAERFTDFKVQIWIICTPYALLQAPGYYLLLIDLNADTNQRELLRSLLAIGKIIFVILFISILFSERGISKKGSITKHLMTVLNVIVLVLSLLLTITQLMHR
ncbi:MAG TPA: hypothetical protein VJ842_20230 [Pyrinomonadaceae bacterium]|nr:hypothetical protein [Pyrinomonadaceae bacterium]